VTAQNLAATTAPVFNWRALARSVGLWALLPLAVYVILRARFEPTSVVPVVAAALIPMLGIANALAKRRPLDVIAIVTLLDIAATVVVTLFVPHVQAILIGNSLGIGILGLAFLGSIPARVPLISLFARQFSNLPAYQAADPRTRTRYAAITARWGLAMLALCAIHICVALTFAPAVYFIAKPVLTLAVLGAVLLWTVASVRGFADEGDRA
jgi:hypothetical protein